MTGSVGLRISILLLTLAAAIGPLRAQSTCPTGFTDLGPTCAKPKPYGRGAGYAWKFGDTAFDWTKNPNTSGMMKRCRAATGGACEIVGALAYPVCRSGFRAVGSNICSPVCPPGMTDAGALCAKGASAPAAAAASPAASAASPDACGLYRIRAVADGAYLQVDPKGDRLLTSRPSSAKDGGLFFLDRMADGTLRLRSRASGTALYEDEKDRLISARSAVADARAAIELDVTPGGAFRILSAATGNAWSYGRGDRNVSARGADDAAAAFAFERVAGRDAVAACAADVLGMELAADRERAFEERRRAATEISRRTQDLLAAAPALATAPAGTTLARLRAASEAFVTSKDAGRVLTSPALDELTAQIGTFGRGSAELVAAAGGRPGDPALARLVELQQAVEQFLGAQASARTSARAAYRNFAAGMGAVRDPRVTRTVVVFKDRPPAGAGASELTQGTAYLALKPGSLTPNLAAGDRVSVFTQADGGAVEAKHYRIAAGTARAGASAASTGSVIEVDPSQLAGAVGDTESVIVAPTIDADMIVSDWNRVKTVGEYQDPCAPTAEGKAEILTPTANMEDCKGSYVRYPGTLPKCPGGKVQSGGLCYPPCREGYTLVAGVCWQSCPDGWDDIGAFCEKPDAYKRRSYPWKFGDTAFSLDEARERCRKAHPAVGCETVGAIVYEKCRPGTSSYLIDYCASDCPAGFGVDMGPSCTKKSHPFTVDASASSAAVETVPTLCESGTEFYGGFCYPRCRAGYTADGLSCKIDLTR